MYDDPIMDRIQAAEVVLGVLLSISSNLRSKEHSEHDPKLSSLIDQYKRAAQACEECARPVRLWPDEDYVMVKDELWVQLVDQDEDLLCRPCMETRLDRPISIEDLHEDAPLCNRPFVLRKA